MEDYSIYQDAGMYAKVSPSSVWILYSKLDLTLGVTERELAIRLVNLMHLDRVILRISCKVVMGISCKGSLKKHTYT